MKISQAVYKCISVADICIASIRRGDAANAAHRCGRVAATTVVQDHWVGAEWVHCFCAPCGMAHLALHTDKSSRHHRNLFVEGVMFHVRYRIQNVEISRKVSRLHLFDSRNDVPSAVRISMCMRKSETLQQLFSLTSPSLPRIQNEVLGLKNIHTNPAKHSKDP